MAYVLVNSKDPGLFYLDKSTDTRDFSKARKYATRKLAEKVNIEGQVYLPMFTSKLLESLTPASSEKDLAPRVDSILLEVKDTIDSSILKIAQIVPESFIESEEFRKSNLSELIKKLEKTRLYLVDLAFRPSYINTDYIPDSEGFTDVPPGAPQVDNDEFIADGTHDSTLDQVTQVMPIETPYADTPAGAPIAEAVISGSVDGSNFIVYSSNDPWSKVEKKISEFAGDRDYQIIVKGIKYLDDQLLASFTVAQE